MNRYNLSFYPPTMVVMGEMTDEEYIEQCADALYDGWVCGYRFHPEELKKLIDIAVQRQKEKREKYVSNFVI